MVRPETPLSGSLVFFLDNAGLSPVLRFGLGHPVLAPMIARQCAAHATLRPGPGKGTTRWIVPDGWTPAPETARFVETSLDWRSELQSAGSSDPEGWILLSNGRFSTQVNPRLVHQVLSTTSAAVVAIDAMPSLLGYHERTLLARDASVVGFRRFYEDSVEPVPMPKAWPHHLLIRSREVDRAFQDTTPCGGFQPWVDRWQDSGLACAAFEVAGVAHDLSTEAGLWGFFIDQAGRYGETPAGWTLVDGRGGPRAAPDCGRCTGRVWVGPRARIGSDVVLVGPSIIGDGVVLKDKAVVASSILGSGVTVDSGRYVRSSLLTRTGQVQVAAHPATGSRTSGLEAGGFRTWPRVSYANSVKRVLDVVTATAVLVLFAPIFPVIALAIKLNSPGPVFFKHRREGRYGKPFHCVKFRSMRTGADQIQEKLRTVSEVDGPQFKMADDPRITRVGHFLRETYLDEIPQFLNVLAGQMSMIGPRPSPKAENTLCPYWRYARLSVRPGVTGLWQVYRTRQPMKDFQEWIYYDTEYVKNLSFWLDAKICLKTSMKMLGRLVEQFERG